MTDDLNFLPEIPTGPDTSDGQVWTVLVVDDDSEIHHVTHLVFDGFEFRGRSVRMLSATSAADARRILEAEPDIAVMLLDVVMETDDAGLQLVGYVRETLGLKALRIILRTGQPGQAPEREVILRYDIDDYRAKTEMTAQKLLTSTIAALRAYDALRSLELNQAVLANSNQELEQRVAERTRALEASEASLRALIAAVPDGIVSYDLNGGIRSFSRAAEAMFGWSAADVIGRSVNDLVPEALALGEGDACDLRGRRQDGTQFLVDVSANRTQLDGRTVFVAALRDVTERFEAQEELRRARDVAEAASRVKSDFLAMMSHEIRTPMNGILGMVQLLTESGLSPVQQDYAETIHGSAQALLAVLNDILDFSKLDTGQLSLDGMAFDPARVVSQVVQMMDTRASEKRLKLSLNLAPGLPPVVMGDPGRLRQILLNLLSNALKFTERGAITVSLTTEPAPTGMAGLRFAVSDTGIGVPREAQGRLFQKFEQVDGSISRRFGGTGLGLAICRRIVDLMGGEIGLDSEEGKGSTFWFALRLPLRVDGSAGGPLPPVAAAGGPPDQRLRVLLVEDDAVSRRVAAAFLDRLGHEAVCAEDGKHALACLTEQGAEQFDAVLMDLHLPDLDGFACADALRAVCPVAARLPIIALTASASPDDVARCKTQNFAGYLAKPLEEAVLRQMLAGVQRERHLKGAQQDMNPAALEALEQALGAEGLGHIVALFNQDALGLTRRIADAVASGAVKDVENLTRELHETSAQFGLEAVRKAARNLGEAALAGKASDSLAEDALCLGRLVENGTAALARQYPMMET